MLSGQEHNKRMKLLRIALKNATSINIFFFQDTCACARSKRCARKYLQSYVLSQYFIPEWRMYTDSIRPDPKKKELDLYPACIPMNPKLFF